MPKRTNTFQKLITQIYSQMATSDERVTESALVREPTGETEREIDILLEKKIFGIDIRIAVECRGRSHKDDIQWIDGLIGKYRNLPIDKVVAVSKSGFSKGAEEKAQANGIDTLTLLQALETDWPSEFTRLGIARVTRRDDPHRVILYTTETVTNSLALSTLLFTKEGDLLGSLEQMGQLIYNQNKEKVTEVISNSFRSFFKTLADLHKHKILVGIPITPSKPIFIDDGDRHLEVTQITVEILSSFSYDWPNISHYILGEKQITQAVLNDTQSKANFSITAIQDSNVPHQVNVHVQKIDTDATKKV